mgnify:FL=1|jgi:hypothetical protein|tara:strand:+ start:9064 stop:10443 length:1380 start_codon:yes stop_codon:yes gene_type:complete
MSIASLKRFEIAPMNQSSGSSVFSYREGNPLIQFEIGAEDLYLMSHTLRINFKLNLKNAPGAANVAPNNNNQVVATGLEEVLLNNKIGCAGCIENITISNLQNNTLEYCRAYPRLLSSLIAGGAGWGDYSGYLTQTFAATANKECQGRLCNREMDVSMPLMCGIFLNGENIPLSFRSGTGGLRISLMLAPSIQALFGSTPATTNNSYYELSQISLTGQYGVPVGGVLPPIKSLGFSAYQNFYSVINNNDNTQQISPSLAAVVSQFTNFVPTTHISSYAQDGYKTTPLLNKGTAAGNPQVNSAPIDGISFLRAGTQYPLRFKIDSRLLVNLVPGAPGGDVWGTSGFDAQRQLYYQSSLRPLRRTSMCLAGANSEGLTIANADVNHNSVTDLGTNGKQQCYGIGCRYDAMGNGSTANFKAQSFSLRLQSRLDGVSPMSAYTYFLHRGVINYDGNGIVSIST